MIQTTCSVCHKPIEVPDSQAGKLETCVHCGWEISIPVPEIQSVDGDKEKVKYRCGECGEKLENPGSMGGHSDSCPMCNFKHIVPLSKSQKRQRREQETQDKEKIGQQSKGKQRYVLMLGFGLSIVGIIIAVSMSGMFNREQAAEKPERPNAPSPSHRSGREPDTSLGKLARFKPLLDDYGATFNSKIKTPKGLQAMQYSLDEKKAVGHISFSVDDADNVIDIECMFGLTQESPVAARIRSGLYAVAVCRLCKDWTVQKESKIAKAILECVDTASKKKDMQAEITVKNNGIEAISWFNATLAIGGISLKRTAPATEHPTPWVYESLLPKQPTQTGNPLIGIDGLTYRLIQSDFGSATVGWQVTVTNKSSTPCYYYVKISFRDSNNFEVAWSNGKTLVVPAGQSYRLSEQAMMKDSIWQQVTTASALVTPYVSR